MTTLFW